MLDKLGVVGVNQVRAMSNVRFKEAAVEGTVPNSRNLRIDLRGSACDDPRIKATLYDFDADGILQSITYVWERPAGPAPAPIFLERVKTLSLVNPGLAAPQLPGGYRRTRRSAGWCCRTCRSAICCWRRTQRRSSRRAARSEIGTDLGRFANVEHFCSWPGLAPATKISGDKVISACTNRSADRVRHALKMAAMSLSLGDSALGAFYRRLCYRKTAFRLGAAMPLAHYFGSGACSCHSSDGFAACEAAGVSGGFGSISAGQIDDLGDGKQ